MLQTIGGGVASLLIIVAVSLSARTGKTSRQGLLRGLVAGVIGSTLASAAGALLSLILPIGQLDFHLAKTLHNWGLIDLWPNYTISWPKKL
jgi:hypothetical protein